MKEKNKRYKTHHLNKNYVYDDSPFLEETELTLVSLNISVMSIIAGIYIVSPKSPYRIRDAAYERAKPLIDEFIATADFYKDKFDESRKLARKILKTLFPNQPVVLEKYSKEKINWIRQKFIEADEKVKEDTSLKD